MTRMAYSPAGFGGLLAPGSLYIRWRRRDAAGEGGKTDCGNTTATVVGALFLMILFLSRCHFWNPHGFTPLLALSISLFSTDVRVGFAGDVSINVRLVSLILLARYGWQRLKIVVCRVHRSTLNNIIVTG